MRQGSLVRNAHVVGSATQAGIGQAKSSVPDAGEKPTAVSPNSSATGGLFERMSFPLEGRNNAAEPLFILDEEGEIATLRPRLQQANNSLKSPLPTNAGFKNRGA